MWRAGIRMFTFSNVPIESTRNPHTNGGGNSQNSVRPTSGSEDGVEVRVGEEPARVELVADRQEVIEPRVRVPK